MEIVKSILTKNPCFKDGRKIEVKGLMLHSVGCPQPSAGVFIKKWNTPEAARACVHAFIDGNTGTVYQTLEWNHRGWHGGGKSNNSYIGVEMCEPACITYGSGASFACSDREAAMAVVKRTYDAAVELFAFLCQEFKLNPLADGVILSHKEGHDRGIATGHADPDHLWNGLHSGYTMDGFRKDVDAAMKEVIQEQKKLEGKEEEKEQMLPPPECPGKGIHEGDVVRIAPDAVYYTGKDMPDWVRNDQWIVKSINGDRAVIDWNVSRERAICSPVHIKYLTAVEGKTISGVPLQPAPPTPPPATPGGSQMLSPQRPQDSRTAPSPAGKPAGEMIISDKGVDMIAAYEGCRLDAYKCPAGVWTIGYGHTAGVNPGDRLASQEAAKALLKEDLKKYGGYVNSCVKKGQITFPLNQNQFDALTSFCYNCGYGNLQKLVGGRTAAEVAEKILQYNKGGGKVLAGLDRRRKEERALFLSEKG